MFITSITNMRGSARSKDGFGVESESEGTF